MAPSRESAPSSPDRLTQEFDARLREVDLLVCARIMESWAQASEFSLEETRLLLVLAAISGPSTAGQLAARSGISIDNVYPALGRLKQHGDVREDQRSYALTDVGEASVASLDAARREGIEAFVSDLDDDARRRLESALGLDA